MVPLRKNLKRLNLQQKKNVWLLRRNFKVKLGLVGMVPKFLITSKMRGRMKNMLKQKKLRRRLPVTICVKRFRLLVMV